MAKSRYKFTFGPWNIHPGADPFGPTVRKEYSWNQKLKFFKKLGFDGVQFHDDDAVPDMAKLNASQIAKKAKAMKKTLDNNGLLPEFVAPRLWEDPRTVDGGYTSNDPKCRKYAKERSRICIDIANELGTKLIVLWLAREGTYIREAKDCVLATNRLAEAMNDMLEYDSEIKIAIEPKPNEPMDHTYIPTAGHAIALGYKTIAPERVGVNIESAHSILAGLDPSDEMSFCIAHDKLWTVHLNDQNGLKFDQDKTFGSANLRRAFQQVWVLEKNGYGKNGEMVGLDIKVMRTQKFNDSVKHLANSREVFLRLLDIVKKADDKKIEKFRQNRDYEGLDMYIMNLFLK